MVADLFIDDCKAPAWTELLEGQEARDNFVDLTSEETKRAVHRPYLPFRIREKLETMSRTALAHFFRPGIWVI